MNRKRNTQMIVYYPNSRQKRRRDIKKHPECSNASVKHSKYPHREIIKLSREAIYSGKYNKNMKSSN